MNALRRDLQDGEFVVLRKDVMAPAYRDFKYRIVQVQGGFGMNHVARGHAVLAYWPADGTKGRIGGWDIDPVATAEFQKELETI